MSSDVLLGRLAWITWSASVAAAIAGYAMTLTVGDFASTIEFGEPGPVLLGLTYSTSALVIARRDPSHRIGWTLAVMGLAASMTALTDGYATLSYLGPRPLVAGLVALWVREWVWFPLLAGAIFFLPLWFPTGRHLSRRWAPAGWLAGLTTLMANTSYAFDLTPDNHLRIFQAVNDGILDQPLLTPYGFLPQITTAPDVFDSGMTVWEVAFAASVVATATLALSGLVVRFHRSRGVERQQLKWFAYSAVPLLFVPALMAAYGSGTVTVVILVLLVGLPGVAVGIAILRYRLYDIDRIVRRTVSYTFVTALLATAYLGLVFLLGAILRPVTAGSDLTVAGSVLVVIVLFNPVRRRVQALVDRRFNRSRYDAEQTVAAFSERLRQEIDLETLTDELTGVVEETMEPSHVGLWLGATGRRRGDR